MIVLRVSASELGHTTTNGGTARIKPCLCFAVPRRTPHIIARLTPKAAHLSVCVWATCSWESPKQPAILFFHFLSDLLIRRELPSPTAHATHLNARCWNRSEHVTARSHHMVGKCSQQWSKASRELRGIATAPSLDTIADPDRVTPMQSKPKQLYLFIKNPTHINFRYYWTSELKTFFPNSVSQPYKASLFYAKIYYSISSGESNTSVLWGKLLIWNKINETWKPRTHIYLCGS